MMSLNYLLEITLVWALCYLFYYVWLRGEKFPRANRFYLLGAILAGPLLPLLPDLSLLAWNNPEVPTIFERLLSFNLETVTVTALGAEETSVSTFTNWGLILSRLWLLGSLIALIRLVGSWRQLYPLIKNNPVEVQPTGYQLVSIPAGGSPFSYANYLFWPADLDATDERWRGVMAHELAHIQQGHSYDLLLIDLLTIAFWWNPLPYLYRRSLRLQHEYLADEAATKTTTFQDVRDYARLLLQHQLVGWVPRPGHAFHHSHLKNRITMLTQPKGASWKLLAILPLFFFLILACNEEGEDLTGVNIAETEAMLAERSQEPAGDATAYSLENGVKVYKVVEQMPIYGDCSAEVQMGDLEEARNCSNTKLLTDIYENIKYPAASRKMGAEGMVVISFVVPADGGKATDFQIVRSAASGITGQDSGTEEKVHVVGHGDPANKSAEKADDSAQLPIEQEAYEALDAAALATAQNLPQDWTAGVQDGKKVAVRFNLPVKFKLE